MARSSAERLVQAALKTVLGDAAFGLSAKHGPYHGDPYSGATADSTIASVGLVHPKTRRPLTLKLDYSEHDLSGQTDSWTLTLAGFSAKESEQLRAALNPFSHVPNANNNLTYRWVIDGKAGTQRRGGN
jgi:hypothetical protein